MKKHFIISLCAGIFALAPYFASAHERQVINVGGTNYLFVAGSLNEPITVDDKTGVDLRVLIADPKNPSDSKAAGAKPATGLEKDLKVEISGGGQKKTIDLSPAYGDPGAYRAIFYPTTDAQLSYRVFGTLNSIPFSQTFSCHPGGHQMQAPDDTAVVPLSDGVTRTLKAGMFGCPVAKADLGFPEHSSSIADIQKNISDIEARLVQKLAEEHTLGFLALLASVFALILGIAALVHAIKKQQ